jgi:hypothetical protein
VAKFPLTDKIALEIANVATRHVTHYDIGTFARECQLADADPCAAEQTVNKNRRIRAILTWAMKNSYENGCAFAEKLLLFTASRGGLRPESPNYVYVEEEVANLRRAFASEGFQLSPDGEILPTLLDVLSDADLTEPLQAYIRRAQKGSEDAALVVGTGKDLLEAIAAYVLHQLRGATDFPHSFPTLLKQAFEALGLKTPADKAVDGEPPQHRLQRALFDAACAVNTLRNKEGTGHGRPWLPNVTEEEARLAIQVMGIVGDMLLTALERRIQQ